MMMMMEEHQELSSIDENTEMMSLSGPGVRSVGAGVMMGRWISVFWNANLISAVRCLVTAA